MGHSWPISLFKCNQSFHRKQTPWSNFNLCPIFNTQHGKPNHWLQIAASICGSCLHLMISYDWPFRTKKELHFITQIKTVHSTICCVCVECILDNELKWLNYTPETTCNTRYIVQRTLIISEYSKQTCLKASQHINLGARFDLLMMI
jgi:hypothetical protein